ncbi:MAG: response regulator transcription factor [Tractidigestivibacter sp.]|jgi:DNA-binding response OmpR family regulator|uniref:response regulator transcription factor n=1 Tax=Tractidigestivibacter sp. TaxID=2847320 RepID=UPI003D923AF3
MARITFVEDDKSVRKELGQLLQSNGHEAMQVTDFSRAADAVLETSPDLVLLDLNLPGVDGTLICRQIRSRSNVPIIVVTSRAGEIDEVMCMTLGADDFVAKPYSSHVLLARIDALLRRAGALSVTPALERDGVRVDVERSRASYHGASVELTKNELRILALLVRRAPAIVSREDLMCELWDSDAFVDDNTLTVNINRLRQTLSSIGVRNWLHTHRGQGYSVSQ